MGHKSAEQAVEYLRDRVADGLRTVVLVAPDDYTIEYLRPDLRGEYSEETFAEVVDSFRLDQPYMAPETDASPVGERRAIVHYHENAFVVQFPISETESILVSLTTVTGRELLGFIEDCREVVTETVEERWE